MLLWFGIGYRCEIFCNITLFKDQTYPTYPLFITPSLLFSLRYINIYIYIAPIALLLLIWINRFFVEDMKATSHYYELAINKWPYVFDQYFIHSFFSSYLLISRWPPNWNIHNIYSEGALFHYLGGYYYRKIGALDKALVAFQKVGNLSYYI